MLRCALCVFVVLPKSLLGLILLSSQGSLIPPGNDTSTLNLDDILEDQPYGIPFSNLERQAVPLAWDDITLSEDDPRLRKKHPKRHRRYSERPHRSDNFPANFLETDHNYSDFASDGNVLSVPNQLPSDRSKLYEREPYFIPSLSRRSLDRSRHLDIPGSSHSILEGAEYTQDKVEGVKHILDKVEGAKHILDQVEGAKHILDKVEGLKHILDKVKGVKHILDKVEGAKHILDKVEGAKHILDKAKGAKYIIDDAFPTTMSKRLKRSSQYYFNLHHRASLSTNSSLHNSSGESPSSNKGSNGRLQETELQLDNRSPGKMNTRTPFPEHEARTVSEITSSRQRRHTPRVTRVKLSQLVETPPEIGQPIILRKRNRIEAKVGVLVVVENSIYRQYMQDNGNNPKAALARIRRYYGMIFSMMDQRFKTIKDPYLSVSVTISGILVAEAREDSSWLERIVDWSTARSHGRGSVTTDRALKKFTKWISGQTHLPEYDHAMVFTAYRLTNKQGASLGGMAYLNAICDTQSGNAVSIVVDTGDFQSVKVATHELAHSLGAYHDGDRQSKSCRPDSNYVMSPLTSHESHMLRNAFFFSPCSIRDMSIHLSKESSSCVRNEPPVYYSYDLQRLPPGQLYSADMQCKLIFGKRSEYCREGNLVDIMCGQLWCRDPNKDNGCRTNTYLTALPGTKCAPNKVCHLGECITDTSRNSVERPELRSSINVFSRTNKPAQSSLRAPEPKMKDPKHLKQRAHIAKRVKRKRKNLCIEDKNSTYCEGLIRVNPGGCERRAIRQYCCFTCRQQQRQRPRRIKFD